jgi:hypothetical protein
VPRSGALERAVIVAVIAVRVMQVAVDEVVDVVAVRHGLVAAAGAMHVARRVPGTAMVGRAPIRVARRDLDHVLIDMILVRVVQVAIVQVVDVPVMADRRVPAVGSVLVRVMGVVRICTSRHGWPPCAR